MPEPADTPPTPLPASTVDWSADLPQRHAWAARPTPADLAPLPGVPAVCLLTDDADRPVQLLTTQHLRRLLLSRLTDPERPLHGKADLAEVVRAVRWRPVTCAFEGRWRYYLLARRLHPREYRNLIEFGPTYFLHIDWAQPVPDLRGTERAWRDAGEYVGPWPTRSGVQETLDGLRDLFDLCRYPEQVRRAPAGQRCAYAEMGRCDAPCDGSVPLAVYVARLRAAWAFVGGTTAEGGGATAGATAGGATAGGATAGATAGGATVAGAFDEWCAAAEQRMRATAAALQFERAALLREQLVFARQWHERWGGRVGPLTQFHALLVLPITRRKAWKLFLFRHGLLEDGPELADRKLAATAPEWLTAQLAAPPGGAAKTSGGTGDRKGGTGNAVSPVLIGHARDEERALRQMEETWLVAHLLHHREGQDACVVRLPGLKCPADLGPHLAATVAERRKRPEPEPPGSEAATDVDTPESRPEGQS